MAMNSSKLSALLLLMLFISSTPIALACSFCPTPSRSPPFRPAPFRPAPFRPTPFRPTPFRPTPSPKTPSPKTPKGPINLPPLIGMPPITIPPIIGGNPPKNSPPIISMPPINIPPINIPPIIGGTPPATGTPPPPSTPSCGQPPAVTTCPIDALKLGACVDILGSQVHIGDAAVQCCPLVAGLIGVEAALCLCTTIKAKLLNINIVLPIALQVLVTCGNAPPPGYTCP